MDTQTSNNLNTEIWQVDTGAELYQGSFDELTQWITEGAVLPQDKVRRGNLRWIEAGKVPSLHKFFDIQNAGAVPPVVTTNSPKPFPQVVSAQVIDPNQTKFCLVHIETEARFLCDGCGNFFCKECPSSFGSTVKVCPMCGAMCKPLEKAFEDSKKSVNFQRAVSEGFGFSDFGRALTYPLKYPASFIFGALFYGIFTFASNAAAIGGIYLLAGSIFCWMLANMLTFGILSNTVENMLQGKLDQNFMPSFDDFNLWDDAVHPLFLNISVYLSSFAPLILICVVMFGFIANSIKSNPLTAQQAVEKAAPETAPDFVAAQNGNEQINAFKELVRKQNERNQQRLQSAEESVKSEVENADSANPSPQIKTAKPPVYDEEKYFQEVNETINKTRQQQLEMTKSAVEAEQPKVSVKDIAQKILMFAVPFILLAGIAALWGLFYMPVAFIVAAYTRNIGSVFNPSVGLDTIKRLGVDYLKILVMWLILGIISGVCSSTLNSIFSPFDLPRLGNIPAIAVGSIVTFYLSIVFSVILGSALYKNSEKFPLFRTI